MGGRRPHYPHLLSWKYATSLKESEKTITALDDGPLSVLRGQHAKARRPRKLEKQVGEGELVRAKRGTTGVNQRFSSILYFKSLELKLMMMKKDYVFKEIDGVDIEATVHWKASKTEAQPSYGIALAFHGGAFVIGSRHFIPEAEIEYLCDANYVVVSADYRLCPQIALRDVVQDAVDAFSWCKSDLAIKIAEEYGIQLNTEKIVTFGQSAGGLLALHLGSLPQPPRAILDFYGVKYLEHEFWHQPLPSLSGIPQFDQTFLDKIHDEPTLTTTFTSLENTAGASENSSGQSKRKGMPAPDLSVPRNAWLFTALKNGTQIRAIMHNDSFEKVEPSLAFDRGFPPTFFIHGDDDSMVPSSFSERAFSDLRRNGVKCELCLVPNQNHGFDAGLSPEDEEWPYVRKGLDFLLREGNTAPKG